jgi:uncharacterized protein DUF4440
LIGRRSLAAVIAALAIGCATSRHPAADRQAVIALENDWIAHEHDRAALERILATDFLHPVFTGDVLTKEQHIAWSTTHVPPATFASRFERLDVRVFGDIAIASGIVAATDSGKDIERTLFTDIFRYRDGRWQAIEAQETPVGEMPKR